MRSCPPALHQISSTEDPAGPWHPFREPRPQLPQLHVIERVHVSPGDAHLESRTPPSCQRLGLLTRLFGFPCPCSLRPCALSLVTLLPRRRVYKGKYFGSRVAVKVLEADAVLRRWGREH
jgi:hypothetical protein